MATKHSCNDGAGPHFGRRTAGCARCDELAAGAKPVVWNNRKAQDAHFYNRLREHDCKKSGCGPVCVSFDW
jgi:hypothetical protein